MILVNHIYQNMIIIYYLPPCVPRTLDHVESERRAYHYFDRRRTCSSQSHSFKSHDTFSPDIRTIKSSLLHRIFIKILSRGAIELVILAPSQSDRIAGKPATAIPRKNNINNASGPKLGTVCSIMEASSFEYSDRASRLTPALGVQVPRARGAGRSGPRRRTGCLTCRARKVRCDEAKPGCANCERLRLRCVYKSPIAYNNSLSSSTRQSRNSTNGIPGVPQNGSSPALGSATAAAAAVAAAADVSQRSPDLNFFSTVLRSDDHHRPIPAISAPMRPSSTDAEPHHPHFEGPFDMLGFMGGITSELEQKHIDLTSGLTGFTNSPSQTMPADLAVNGAGGGHFGNEHRSPFSADSSSSLADGASIADMSEANTRRSWSDPGNASYEDQLLQHFLTIDPPAVIFGPINMEWKYVRPSVMEHSRDFSPLLNALYCYSDVHKAVTEGKQWRWAPTYYRVANSEIHACLLGEVNDTNLTKIFAAVFFLMLSEVCSSSKRRRKSSVL